MIESVSTSLHLFQVNVANQTIYEWHYMCHFVKFATVILAYYVFVFRKQSNLIGCRLPRK